jgi:hypothetical protein
MRHPFFNHYHVPYWKARTVNFGQTAKPPTGESCHPDFYGNGSSRCDCAPTPAVFLFNHVPYWKARNVNFGQSAKFIRGSGDSHPDRSQADFYCNGSSRCDCAIRTLIPYYPEWVCQTSGMWKKA